MQCNAMQCSQEVGNNEVKLEKSSNHPTAARAMLATATTQQQNQ